MNDQHVRELLGAYTLGILDDDERGAVERHLTDCGVCSDELAEFDDVADLLGAVDDDAWPGEPTGAPHDDLVLQRTLRAVRSEHTRGSRRRAVLAAGAVAALVLVSGYAGSLLGGRDDAPPVAQPTVSPTATPSGVLDVAGTDATTGVRLEASVVPLADWVRLDVHVTGVGEGERCQLVAVTADGDRQVAGSWVIGPRAAGPEGLSVAGSAAVSVDDLARIEVVTFDGEQLVAVDV